LIAFKSQASSSIIIRVTKRPIRPNPFTPIPVAIDKEESFDEAAFRDVPEKDDPEKAETEPIEAIRARVENFILFYFYLIFAEKDIKL